MPPSTTYSAEHVFYEFARLQSMSRWWHWMLLAAVIVALLAAITALYRRDSGELPRGTGWLLLALRVLALAGVLFFFFDLEKRSRREVVSPSRALMLIDTSQSMGLRDAESDSSEPPRSRIEEVASELADGSALERLSADHDVVVYRFDETARPVEIASRTRRPTLRETANPVEQASTRQAGVLRRARRAAAVAGLLLLVALAAGALFVQGRRSTAGIERSAWALLASVMALIAALVALAVASLSASDLGMLAVLGLRAPRPPVAEAPRAPVESPDAADAAAAHDIDWDEQLQPRGVETRLGDALRTLVNQERGGPVAGIVLMSDGRNNAGVQYEAAVAAARDAHIPVYPIGLGSDQRPINARVVDLETPPRVYPGDAFQLIGYVQAYGLSGRPANVQLFSAPADAADPDQAGRFEGEQRIALGADGQLSPVRFEAAPEEPGRRTYRLRLAAPAEDSEESDNEKTADVQVVQRKNRVLLLAGGPTREYRFLRSLLYRDRDTTVDVLLQSGLPGMSQEADQLLFEFPDTPDQLFQYDAIAAFDPDWLALSDSQIELLDRWVAEQAGGLIVVAGPVYTPLWANRRRGDRRIDTIKGLYPVIFYSRGSASLDLGRFGSETAWPLEFTREGREAEFLWLEDDSLASQQAWAALAGVYGYYAVKGPKPGARVYARHSDPDTAVDQQLPIYMASQFYGAGRVFYLASGEMWRLRAADPDYFDRLYTKLIRWVSEGRLLRDSSRGLLLVDKDRCLLGDQVAVRAMLVGAQHEPLTDAEVTAALIHPDGARTVLTLRRVIDSPREGTYAGQFTAMQEGDYRIEMTPPGARGDELLTRQVRTRLPDLEIEHPERNDALMKDIAQKTGGQYFLGMAAALEPDRDGRAPLDRLLEPQDQITYLTGAPDPDFQRRLMAWLMALICSVLCLEWLVRRLNRLA